MAQIGDVCSYGSGDTQMNVMVCDVQDGVAFVQELGNEEGEIIEVDESDLGPVIS